MLLDAMATVGDIDRVPNPKRSAAQKLAAKKRAVLPRPKPQRRQRAKMSGVFTPKYVSGEDQWYAPNDVTKSAVGAPPPSKAEKEQT